MTLPPPHHHLAGRQYGDFKKQSQPLCVRWGQLRAAPGDPQDELRRTSPERGPHSAPPATPSSPHGLSWGGVPRRLTGACVPVSAWGN